MANHANKGQSMVVNGMQQRRLELMWRLYKEMSGELEEVVLQ